MLLTQKRSLFTVAGYRVLGISLPRLRDLAPILIIWAIAIVIMGISNDFGPALLLFSTVLGMLFMATGRVSWLLIGVVLVGVGGFGIYQISAKIQQRFSNFLDPLAIMMARASSFPSRYSACLLAASLAAAWARGIQN